MKKLLVSLYYDGYTLADAIDFLTRCYGEAPTERQIQSAKDAVKSCMNKEWN